MIEETLRELLIPVFGLNSIDEIQPGHSLVVDLGATSIDFVEISYIIESHFNVTIKTNELMVGGVSLKPDELFQDGILTQSGADMLNRHMQGRSYSQGQPRRQLYESITVADLANIIQQKQSHDHV